MPSVTSLTAVHPVRDISLYNLHITVKIAVYNEINIVFNAMLSEYTSDRVFMLIYVFISEKCV